MDKKLGGQPMWLWAFGAVVVIGGFLYFRSHSSSSLQQPAQPAGGSTGTPSTSTFSETIKDIQSNPKGKKHKKSGDN